MNTTNSIAPSRAEPTSPIVELRQYTLHPARRDSLIDLFDSTFVETQEEVGMAVIGQFRDLDDPDRFVWLRGFPSMEARASSLKEFYYGPVWHSNRDAATSTMVDSDDVLLLRPARHNAGFRPNDRQPLGVDFDVDRGVVEATILALQAPAGSELVSRFERQIAPALVEAGFSTLGYFVTEPSPNNFPRLPVREDVNVFVWFAGFADRVTYERTRPDHSAIDSVIAGTTALQQPPQRLRLEPTSRSALTGSSRACAATAYRTSAP